MEEGEGGVAGRVMGRLGGSKRRKVFGTALAGYVAINFCNIFDSGVIALVNIIFFNFHSE